MGFSARRGRSAASRSSSVGEMGWLVVDVADVAVMVARNERDKHKCYLR